MPTDDEREVNWGYGRELPPDLWHLAYPVCGGTKQSPIDIETGIASKITKGGLLQPKYKKVKLTEVLVHHHVEVDVKKAGCMMIGSQKHTLKQFHVHVPSEHTIDGDGAAMEVHFVHDEDGSPPRQVVVAVLVNESGMSNGFLKQLASHLPSLSSRGKKPARLEIDPNCGFPVDTSYFRYEGSLTTPACTEKIDWFVLKKKIEATPDEIDAFRQFAPGGNNRPIQNRNGRSIHYFEPKTRPT